MPAIHPVNMMSNRHSGSLYLALPVRIRSEVCGWISGFFKFKWLRVEDLRIAGCIIIKLTSPGSVIYTGTHRIFSYPLMLGRVALITCASRGIGRSIGHRLSKDGFHVMLTDPPARTPLPQLSVKWKTKGDRRIYTFSRARCKGNGHRDRETIRQSGHCRRLADLTFWTVLFDDQDGCKCRVTNIKFLDMRDYCRRNFALNGLSRGLQTDCILSMSYLC